MKRALVLLSSAGALSLGLLPSCGGDGDGATTGGSGSGGAGTGAASGTGATGSGGAATGGMGSAGDASSGGSSPGFIGGTPEKVFTSSVDPSRTRAISPYIYGYNQEKNLGLDLWTSRRLGGNRTSTLSWENGNSNAGSDNNNNAGAYRLETQICEAFQEQGQPGTVYKSCSDHAAGSGPLFMTLPLMGWVSSDTSGIITTAPPSADWQAVVPVKGAAFSPAPDPTDGFVYLDESVDWIKSNIGAGQTYVLGNEPSIWHNTHQLAFGTTIVTPAEHVAKTIAAAKAVRSVDPTATIVVGELTGSGGVWDLRNPTGSWANDGTCSGGCDWYVDYLLAQLKAESDAWCPSNGCTALVDAVAMHPYPQVKGECGLNVHKCPQSATPSDVRLQQPRTLYDDSFVEKNADGSNGWLVGSKAGGEPLRYLHRLQASIDTYYPGLKIGLGEYNYGNYQYIDGGLAHIDALGAMGALGVYSAHHWADGTDPGDYLRAAYRFFLDVDGSGLDFGTTSLLTTVAAADRGALSVWAADADGVTHVIVLNKQLTGEFGVELSLGATHTLSETYVLDGSSAAISPAPDARVNVEGAAMWVTIPALSAYHIVLTKG